VEDLKKLSPEKFACEADAIKGLSKLFKQFKYHQINQSKVTQIKSKKKDSSGEISSEISATFSHNESKINTEFLRAWRLFFADSRENRVPGNDYGFMSAGLYFSSTTN
jgi:hypothetical protein